MQRPFHPTKVQQHVCVCVACNTHTKEGRYTRTQREEGGHWNNNNNGSDHDKTTAERGLEQLSPSPYSHRVRMRVAPAVVASTAHTTPCTAFGSIPELMALRPPPPPPRLRRRRCGSGQLPSLPPLSSN